MSEVLSFDPPEVAEASVNDFPLYHASVGEAGNKITVQLRENVFEEDV